MLEINPPPSLNEISGGSRDPGVLEINPPSLNEIFGVPRDHFGQRGGGFITNSSDC